MPSPLADRVRPLDISQVCGQKHLLGEGKVLRRIIDSGNIPNLIFYGPSGIGKTTVANIIAAKCGKKLYHLNATTASTSDIKAIIDSLDTIEAVGGVMLYLDEIQYFNKKQQQILLQYIENGDITLIASTTENPYFYVYNAILSRSSVFEFKTVAPEEVVPAILRAKAILEKENKVEIELKEEIALKIARAGAGDVRRCLNILDLCFITQCGTEKVIIDDEVTEEILQNNAVRYDREGDEHFDIISAYQKSMRGSDPDAAIYYLGCLLAAGDIQSACRRLLVCANEDVGLAYPQIIPIVKAAVDTALQVGLPEARIPLANAVILTAISPKSVTGHDAIATAMDDIERAITGDIPRHLQNKHYDGEDAAVKGQHYLYPHSFPNHYVEQQYLPDRLKERKYYNFGDNASEQKFREYWAKIKGNN